MIKFSIISKWQMFHCNVYGMWFTRFYDPLLWIDLVKSCGSQNTVHDWLVVDLPLVGNILFIFSWLILMVMING